MDYSDNFLMHYGVPGMKWGVRRRGENEPGRSQKKKNSVKEESDKKERSVIQTEESS